MRAGSRSGSLVPTSMRNTLPSVRNSAACNSRAPSPRRSSNAPSFSGELLDGAEHVALERDRFGEALLRDRGRDRQARRDRLVVAAERLIDAAHELRAEARRERRARAVEHVGDALQADLRERFDGFGGEAQRGEGEGREDISLIARRNDPHPIRFAHRPPPFRER